jgi:hypothetical protein
MGTMNLITQQVQVGFCCGVAGAMVIPLKDLLRRIDASSVEFPYPCAAGGTGWRRHHAGAPQLRQ